MASKAEIEKATGIAAKARGCSDFYLLSELRSEYNIGLLEAKHILDEAVKGGKIEISEFCGSRKCYPK